jgi:hypothetical protein
LTVDAFIEQGARGRVADLAVLDHVEGGNGQWRDLRHSIGCRPIGTLYRLADNREEAAVRRARPLPVRADELDLTLEQGSVVHRGGRTSASPGSC